MFTIENAQLVLKDKNGNVARLQNLGPDDIVKINNAIADIGKLVDPVSHLPIKATATTVGVVQLADDEAIAAGTTGRVVDAKQLQDAVMGITPANCVTNVAAGSTANKIKVTKDGYTATIVIDNVEHASFANQATHATLADIADIATRATKADDATHAAKADEATHAAKADDATHAANADNAAHAVSADNATYAVNAVNADNATHAANADNATHAANADNAAHAINADAAANADNAAHAVSADNATYAVHAVNADAANTAGYANNTAHAVSADNGVDSYGTGWLRFINGIQICWASAEFEQTVAYQKAFASAPRVVCTCAEKRGETQEIPQLLVVNFYGKNATSFAGRVWNVNDEDWETDGNFDWIAIGRWK